VRREEPRGRSHPELHDVGSVERPSFFLPHAALSGVLHSPVSDPSCHTPPPHTPACVCVLCVCVWAGGRPLREIFPSGSHILVRTCTSPFRPPHTHTHTHTHRLHNLSSPSRLQVVLHNEANEVEMTRLKVSCFRAEGGVGAHFHA